MLSFSEVVKPDEPLQEDDDVEEGAEDPVVYEVPGAGIIDKHEGENYDPEDVHPMHDKDGGRYVPEFVFPGTGKEEE